MRGMTGSGGYIDLAWLYMFTSCDIWTTYRLNSALPSLSSPTHLSNIPRKHVSR